MVDRSRLFDYAGGETARSTRFLAGVHTDDVAVILGHTQTRTYPAGGYAVRAGQRDRTLYVITGGAFEVVLPGRVGEAGGEAQAATLIPGDIFGELSFFDDEPRSADVRALVAAEVVVLTPAGFERLRVERPRLALLVVMDLGRVLSLRYRQLGVLGGPKQ
ncbi:MAG TPA: cyclic nucleotide-binding domain-containing protein [Pseudonocardiaceae bacterium]|jgi:CRP-like cAMP-binding protein|nr:cyclic nucleotide-binding domain-containing protein [Pseudonocardiaceae bacterium]